MEEQLLQLLDAPSSACPELAAEFAAHARALRGDAAAVGALRAGLLDQAQRLAAALAAELRPAQRQEGVAAATAGDDGTARLCSDQEGLDEAASGCSGHQAGPGGASEAPAAAVGQGTGKRLALLRAFGAEAAALRVELEEEAGRLEAEAGELEAECGAERGALLRGQGTPRGVAAEAAAEEGAGGPTSSGQEVGGRASPRAGSPDPPATPGSTCGGSADLDAAVAELLARFPLAPRALRRGVADAAAAAAAAHASRRGAWRAAAAAAAAAEGAAGCQIPPLDAAQHSLYVAARVRAHQRAAATPSGCGGAASAAAALAAMLPTMSPQQLQAHERW
jgi:hypothetical protein